MRPNSRTVSSSRVSTVRLLPPERSRAFCRASRRFSSSNWPSGNSKCARALPAGECTTESGKVTPSPAPISNSKSSYSMVMALMYRMRGSATGYVGNARGRTQRPSAHGWSRLGNRRGENRITSSLRCRRPQQWIVQVFVLPTPIMLCSLPPVAHECQTSSAQAQCACPGCSAWSTRSAIAAVNVSWRCDAASGLTGDARRRRLHHLVTRRA